MPNFSEYKEIEVDVHFEVSVDDFLDACIDSDIKDVIDWLRESDYLKNYDQLVLDNNRGGNGDWEFNDAMAKLSNAFYQLSNEETNLIIQLAKRF
jgi:hypothetical protein